MATFARQQETAIDSGDPASVSITPSATTSLLIAMMSERSGTGHTPHTVTDNSGGDTWTKIGGHDQELANANARHSASWWWKEAGTTSAITVSADDGTANTKGLTVYEFTTDEAGTWTQREIASGDSGTGSDGATGITVTPDSVSAGDNLCMAFGGWRVNGAGQPNTIAFSGSYADQYSSGSSGSNELHHANEWFQDADGGVEATTLTWNDAGHEGLCAVIIFELVVGGGATLRRYSLSLTGVG